MIGWVNYNRRYLIHCLLLIRRPFRSVWWSLVVDDVCIEKKPATTSHRVNNNILKKSNPSNSRSLQATVIRANNTTKQKVEIKDDWSDEADDFGVNSQKKKNDGWSDDDDSFDDFSSKKTVNKATKKDNNSGWDDDWNDNW